MQPNYAPKYETNADKPQMQPKYTNPNMQPMPAGGRNRRQNQCRRAGGTNADGGPAQICTPCARSADRVNAPRQSKSSGIILRCRV